MLLIRFTKFVLVGGVATSIQYLLLFILVHWNGVNPVLASSLGFVVSAFANYLLNYYYTFRSKHQHGTALFKFMTIAGIGLILNSTIMQVLTVEGLHYLIAQAIATAVVLLWSFTGNSLWTFRTDSMPKMTTPIVRSSDIRNNMYCIEARTPAAKSIILISLTLLALLIAAQEKPLEGMHWDVPTYLYQAKRFAETHYLADYTRHSAEIVAQVHGHVPSDEAFSEAFWHFIRIGHIVVLGSVVDLFGSTLEGIAVSTWLYTLFLIGGIAFCFSSVLILGLSTEHICSWFEGAALSTLLFLLSDIYGYLAGNLISEVLSILLLGAALLAVMYSFKTGRLSFAIISGLLAFLGYTARVESVWTWLAFILAYVVTCGAGIKQSVPWKPILVAGFVALGFYLVYSAIFYPLADPRHYLEFVSGLIISNSHKGVPAYQLLFVVGGLLWVGTLASLRWLGQSGLVRLGWLWMVLSAFPWLPQIMLGGPSQTRMMTLLIPPLFLLSSAGWSLLLKQGERRPIKIATVGSLCLVLVSQPSVYAWLHGIPGLWRVQLVRPFLFAPRYERLDYLPIEMATLSHAIYSNNEPRVLVSNPKISQEYLNLIRFFGSSYSADSDLALRGDPTNKKSCDYKFLDLNESVLFCQGYSDPAAMSFHRDRYRILFLEQDKASATTGNSLLLKTPNFALNVVRN